MKGIVLAYLAMALTVAAWAGDAQTAAPESGSIKGEIPVGEVFPLTLPCNPTTGYQWELKSINRKIAVTTGPAQFQQSPAKPGMMGTGGSCLVGIQGVKTGKTKAVFVYRRSGDKGEPAKTFTAHMSVVPKKASP